MLTEWTYEGIGKKIIQYVKTKRPEFPIEKLKSESCLNQLCMKLYHALNKVSPRTTDLRKIICKTERIIIKLMTECIDKKDKVFFTNVLKHEDCLIHWDYKVRKTDEWGVYI